MIQVSLLRITGGLGNPRGPDSPGSPMSLPGGPGAPRSPFGPVHPEQSIEQSEFCPDILFDYSQINTLLDKSRKDFIYMKNIFTFFLFTS